MMKPQEAFHAILAGEQVEATPETAALTTLASALRPQTMAGPDPRFKARLRSELLAAATEMAEAEVESFAAMLGRSRSAVPAAIRPLVAVAQALEPATMSTPAPAFRYQLRRELVRRAEAGPSLATRARSRVAALNSRMTRSLRTVAATGMAATMLAGGSMTMAAASNALPVDTLYGVKMIKESAELLGEGGTKRGFTHLDHARERLDEIRGMLRRPVNEQGPYVGALHRMDDQTIAGQTLIFEEFQKAKAPRDVVIRVDRFARQQLYGLAGLRERLPEGARPAATDSLIVLASVIRRADLILDNAPATEGASAPKGCNCDVPSNALVQPRDDGATCACDQPPTNDGGRTPPGGNDEPTDPDEPDGPDSPPRPVDVPEVEGTEADNEAEELINELLNQLPDPPASSEVPLPLPGLPVSPEPPVGSLSDVISALPTL